MQTGEMPDEPHTPQDSIILCFWWFLALHLMKKNNLIKYKHIINRIFVLVPLGFKIPSMEVQNIC